MLIVTATILARSPAGPGAPRLSIGDGAEATLS